VGRSRRKKRERIQGELQQPRQHALRRLLALPRGLWIVAGILATIGGVLSLLPKVVVYAGAPLDPSQPFTTPFTISNEGYLPIHDVTFRCRIRRAQAEDGAAIIAYEKGISPTGFAVPLITPGEKSTVACPFPFEFNAPFAGADFDFVVVFRPDWLLWHQEKSFRFGTTKTKEGQLIWLPRAVSE